MKQAEAANHHAGRQLHSHYRTLVSYHWHMAQWNDIGIKMF